MQSLNLQYNPRIDQLRWLAATIVFVFHFQMEYRQLGGPGIATQWAALITEGHTGVGLFFTLSGFLFMQIALHQRTIVYRDFLRNRILRIAPLFLTIYLVATSIGRDTFQPQDLLYIFATNLGHAPTSGSLITGAAWTISLEFLFYMVFPFLARFALERGPRYLLGLLVLMLFFKVSAYTVNQNSVLMYFCTFVGRFDQFLIGMLAAMLIHGREPRLQAMAPWLLPLATLMVVWDTAALHLISPLGGPTKHPFWITWSMIEATGWALFIVAWVSFTPRLPAALDRVICFGGTISFSFYLLHMAVIHILGQSVGRVRPTGNGWIDAAIMMAICYVLVWIVATISYKTIEEPFLRMRRRYGAERNETASMS